MVWEQRGQYWLFLANHQIALLSCKFYKKKNPLFDVDFFLGPLTWNHLFVKVINLKIFVFV